MSGMMGGLGKILGKTTDMLGLTNNDELAAQQKMAEEQAQAQKDQASLEANGAKDNVADINSAGSASDSAATITGDQKKRRAAAQGNPLGL